MDFKRADTILTKIEEVEPDFYAGLLGLVVLELAPAKTDEDIVEAVLGAYRYIQARDD